jgi:hypothetical protein
MRWLFLLCIQEHMIITRREAKRLYSSQRSGAKRRGIEFKFTFEQWLEAWGDNLDRRGNRAWDLVMCRINDEGTYEPGNVYIARPNRNHASRRMALENKRGSESRHAWVSPDGYDEPETDEEWIASKLGVSFNDIYG